MKKLSFKNLSSYDSVLTAMSMKEHGSMRLPHEDGMANRESFLVSLGITHDDLVRGELQHESNVEVVRAKDKGEVIGNCDALITQDPNTYLAITVADCLPVFLCDPEHLAIGLVHAGWRSIVGGIVGNTIDAMHDNFGTDPSDVLVGIGPGIADCHFEVQDDVRRKFIPTYSSATKIRENKKFIDLKHIVSKQFIAAGVDEKNIETHPDCTHCLDDKYFSFRREGPMRGNLMLVVMGIKKNP